MCIAGHVKLFDYGASCVINGNHDGCSDNIRVCHDSVGSPSWMAPEVIANLGDEELLANNNNNRMRYNASKHTVAYDCR